MKTLEVYSFEGFLLSDRCLYTILKSGINNSIYNSTAYFYTFLDGIYTVMARTTKPLTTAEINNAKPLLNQSTNDIKSSALDATGLYEML